MNILIDMPVYSPLLAELQNIPGVTVRLVEPSETSRPLAEEVIAEVDVLFCTCPPSNHKIMRQLKMIQISSAGYTQLIGQQ
ncbi:MAG: hypothetical protein ABI151_07780, partial [Chitinophagaceae bacterium]